MMRKPAAPPHDPYSLILAGHIGPSAGVGWRRDRAIRVDVDPGTRSLVLSPSPASARWLTEPNATFGGLRLPPNVAVSDRGDVFLLDLDAGALRRFDGCACRFAAVPCFARLEPAAAPCDVGAGATVRHDRLRDPRALAFCGGDLFVADRGHARVLRYAAAGLVPRGALRLPAAERAALAAPWYPSGLAFSGRTLIVADPLNGRLDRFDRTGRWLGTIGVPAGVSHVAVDCRGRIYVLVERDAIAAAAAGAAPTTVEIDAQRDGFHWHTLALSQIPPGSTFAIDLQAGDDAWTALHLNDPGNKEWVRWLGPDAVARALVPQALPGVLGRYLRLRFVPAAASAAGAFNVLTHGASAAQARADGSLHYLTDPRADSIEDFGRPPFPVDLNGHLHLHCEGTAGVQVFDAHGGLVPLEQRATGEQFEREGTFFSTALDSAIDGCQWHRIELRGAIPQGCSVEVRTASAGLAFTRSELPESAWVPGVVARAMEPADRNDPSRCAWDALVYSSPGRYLWIQLVLRGDGRQTPCVSAAVVEYPRISLRRYLPSVFSFDPAGADFTDRFTAVFDRTLRSMETALDTFPAYLDPLSAPAEAPAGETDFLTWLGDWIGVTLARDWTVERRRHYLKQIARLYARRGTVDGLRRQLLLLLGFDEAYGQRCLAERPRRHCVRPLRDCDAGPVCAPAEPPPLILEHFKLRRWLYAGHGRLGSDSLLWGKQIVNRSELSGETSPPSGNAQVGVTRLDTMPDPLHDPFGVYAHRFSVFVPSRIRDNASERRALERLMARETPAHAVADIRYVEPRFRVGVQATIGLDAVVARMPRGVTVDTTTLGRGSVLTGRRRAPGLEVGNARVGTTTRLT